MRKFVQGRGAAAWLLGLELLAIAIAAALYISTDRQAASRRARGDVLLERTAKICAALHAGCTR